MTIAGALSSSRLPSLEAEVLMAALLKRDRTWVLAHGEEAMSLRQAEVWNAWVRRRRRGEPVAYVIGEREFYGRMFRVTPAVLIPRPATEQLVEQALALLPHPAPELASPALSPPSPHLPHYSDGRGRGGSASSFCVKADTGIVILTRVLRPELLPKVIVDVGTGSGCIAVTLALERSGISIIATDVSEDALAVARENAERYGVLDRLDFRLGNALEPILGLSTPFLVISNPPYIPEGRELPQEVCMFEPAQALYAGIDGMDVLRQIFSQVRRHPRCAGIIVECQADQVRAVMDG